MIPVYDLDKLPVMQQPVAFVADQLLDRMRQMNAIYIISGPLLTPTLAQVREKYVMVIEPNLMVRGGIKGRLLKHDHPLVGQLIGGH